MVSPDPTALSTFAAIFNDSIIIEQLLGVAVTDDLMDQPDEAVHPGGLPRPNAAPADHSERKEKAESERAALNVLVAAARDARATVS